MMTMLPSQTLVMGPIEKELVDTDAKAKEMGLKGEMIGVLADIRAKEGRQAVSDAITKSGKTLRTIIHNAGVNTPCKMMMDIGVEDWERVITCACRSSTK